MEVEAPSTTKVEVLCVCNFSFKNPVHKSRWELDMQLVKCSAACGDTDHKHYFVFPHRFISTLTFCSWRWKLTFTTGPCWGIISEPHLAQSHPLNSQLPLFTLTLPSEGYLSSRESWARQPQGYTTGKLMGEQWFIELQRWCAFICRDTTCKTVSACDGGWICARVLPLTSLPCEEVLHIA